MNQSKNQNGFTIIELVISMGFIAGLLILITMTVMRIGNIYTKGVTLKETNQSGRLISSELQNGISVSNQFSLDSTVGDKYTDVLKKSKTGLYVLNDYGGRLCLGQYSYIWNYGYAINQAIASNDYSKLNAYQGVAPSSKMIRFVKAQDSATTHCQNPATPTTTVPSSAIELLVPGQGNLAMQDFKIINAISPVKQGQTIYNISFTIGTNDWSAMNYTLVGQKPTNVSCKPPSDVLSNVLYCSISDFNIVMRSSNE